MREDDAIRFRHMLDAATRKSNKSSNACQPVKPIVLLNFKKNKTSCRGSSRQPSYFRFGESNQSH